MQGKKKIKGAKALFREVLDLPVADHRPVPVHRTLARDLLQYMYMYVVR